LIPVQFSPSSLPSSFLRPLCPLVLTFYDPSPHRALNGRCFGGRTLPLSPLFRCFFLFLSPPSFFALFLVMYDIPKMPVYSPPFLLTFSFAPLFPWMCVYWATFMVGELLSSTFPLPVRFPPVPCRAILSSPFCAPSRSVVADTAEARFVPPLPPPLYLFIPLHFRSTWLRLPTR